jgi:hypothetical protein
MGYSTEFDGTVTVEPPLNHAERTYLEEFAGTRRMQRAKGPYFVGGNGLRGQAQDDDVTDYNSPPAGQPGLWCQWVPTDDGTGIEWDGNEKFYNGGEWMQYIIDHFLAPEGEADCWGQAQFANFTFNHFVNGTIYASGEDPGDLWRIVVTDNVVDIQAARISYGS